MLDPTEQLSLVASNANAGAIVSGTAFGYLADTSNEIAVTNAGIIAVQPPQPNFLTTMTGVAFTPVTQTVAIHRSTRALMLVAHGVGGSVTGPPADLSVVGHTTQTIFAAAPVEMFLPGQGGSGGYVVLPVSGAGVDTAVDITLHSTTSTWAVDVIELFDVSTTYLADLWAGQPIGNTGSTFGIPVAISGGNLAVSNTTVTANLAGLGSLVVECAGRESVGFFLAAGTLVATVVTDLSYDGGTTWIPWVFYNAGQTTIQASLVFAAPNTNQSRSIPLPGGVTHVRVRVSAYTSGAAVARLQATTGQGVAVQGPGTITVAQSWLTAISDLVNGPAAVKAANVAALAADAALVVAPSPNSPIALPSAASYSAAAKALSTGALGAGGVKVLMSIWHTATAAKRVRLRRLWLSIDSNTAATILTIELLRFGNLTVPSGGTALTPTPNDQSDAACEASVMTLPTTVGATEIAVPVAMKKINLGIIAGSTSDLFRDALLVYDDRIGVRPAGLRVGNQEGWNVKLTSSIATTLVGSLWPEFTED